MMWLLLAAGSAIFAGITSILAKIGIRDVDSTLATALRTIVVVVFAWILVFFTGSPAGLFHISRKTMLFLILSGAATGASWLCYFKALQTGDMTNKKIVSENR